MSEGLQLILNDDGVLEEYDDTYDLTIHCKNEEEQEEVFNKLNRRWIPVSERLPEIHQDVLLSLRSLNIEVGFRAKTEPYFYCHGTEDCYIESQNVIAWMPLPEPYKEDKEKRG